MKREGPDRRYIYRHRVNGVCAQYRSKVWLGFATSDLSQPCEVTDINYRGMRLYAESKLHAGSTVDFYLDCPGEMELSTVGPPLQGKVVWRAWSAHRERWRTGVHFINVSDASREALLRLVDIAVARTKLYGPANDVV